MKTLTGNQQRVDAARAAVEAYRRAKESGGRPDSQSLDEWLIDLLTDLRHLGATQQFDFAAAVRTSEFHFEEESFTDV